MKKFDVEVVETLSRVVETEAKDYNEAVLKVADKYHNEDIVLDYNDLEKTDYKAYPSRELANSIKMNIEYNKENESISIGDGKGFEKSYKCKNMDDFFEAIETYSLENIKFLEPKGEKIVTKSMER